MIKVKRKVAFQGEVHKRRDAAKAARVTLAQSGRIPRIAKLVALANRMQSMLESGEVESFQQLAELGRISQPRMSQIMSLLNLAPEIQEELFYLPEVIQGKAQIHELLVATLVGREFLNLDGRSLASVSRDQKRRGDGFITPSRFV